ncbi:deoxyuridine 5'-triphosphate nucleotidohydrolase, mitochondrial isoform X2 [Lepisosteus oculatus]|uniref:deoxyuridine 5'-triphosphate nucleotidohydrolase, mitochondrial isoform X2 n=1 Tax=Lepisosteus oculatus TaxID=7918 RepID=UPI0037235715
MASRTASFLYKGQIKPHNGRMPISRLEGTAVVHVPPEAAGRDVSCNSPIGGSPLFKTFGGSAAVQFFCCSNCGAEFTFFTEAVTASSPAKRQRTDTTHEIKVVLKFAKLSENATTPTKGSSKAAGYDLYSAYDYSIPPLEKTVVKTDIQIAVPPGCYGRVAPRSGLAAKHFIDVGAGVVDEDYRGNVGVVLFNFSKETFEVKKGDRVAQLICERICYPEIEQHETLDETERGAGGFGSTGRN